MSARRILKWGSAILGIVGLLVVIVGIFIARSQWFRDFARSQIISTVEEATGGRVEISAFRFDWTRLHAEIDNFVLHGTEPATAEPLLRTRRLTVDLKLFSLFRKKMVDISGIEVVEPRVNLIVLTDGNTNIPKPQVKKASDKTALETIVDLEVGRFDIRDGFANVSERKLNFSGRGENLRAQLVYELIRQRYSGSVSLQPLIVQSANNTPLPINVDLPLLLERDKVQVERAVLSTANSRVEITGQLEHLLDPRISSRVSARIDLAEMQRTLGAALSFATRRNVPRVLTADLDFATDDKGVRVSSAKAVLGKSSFEANGSFESVAFEKGEIQFQSALALDELSRLANGALTAEGTAQLKGKALIYSRTDYTADATLDAPKLSVHSGEVQIRDASIATQITADPRQVRLTGIRARLAGGEFTGDGSLLELARYQVNGRLARFDISNIVRMATSRNLGYGGTVSGTVGVNGDLKAKGTSSLNAQARLSITPTRSGVPVRGNLNVSYDGRRDVVDVGNSVIDLPSTRLELSGSLGRQIAVRLNSRNLNDLLPAIALGSDKPPQTLPVRFAPGGAATLQANVQGRLRSPTIDGHASLTRFEASGRPFDLASADFRASATNVAAQNGVVTRGALRMDLQGAVGLMDWKTTNGSPIQAAATIRNADLLDILALAGQADLPLRGALSLNARASGTVGDPRGTADIAVQNGEAYGEPVDRLTANVTLAGQQVDLPALDVVSGVARLRATGSFLHPAGSFDTGTFRGHVEGDQIALARLKNVRSRRPDLDGNVRMNADVVAELRPENTEPRLQLTSVDGTLTATNLRLQQRQLGQLNAKVSTQGKQVAYQLDSNFAGSTIRANGQTNLDNDYMTTADLDIRDLPVEDVLLVAGRSDLELKGRVAGQAKISGTIQDPSVVGDLELTQALYRTQPIDRLAGHIDYAAQRIQLANVDLVAGPNRLQLSGSFDHPRQVFTSGRFQLKAESNNIQLKELKLLEELRPGLAGTAQIAIDAAGTLNNPQSATRVTLSAIEGRVEAKGVQVNGRDYGNLLATAERGGNGVLLNVDSNLAQSIIKGSGELQLNAGLPMKADVTFTNVRYSNWAGLFARSQLGTGPDFDALLEGNVQLAGPASQPERLTGKLEVSRVEVSTTTRTSLSGPTTALALRNEGPVVVVANQAGIQVQQAHLTGPKTDVRITGGATLQPAIALNLTVNSNIDLDLVHQIDRSISSAGSIAINASVNGPLREPAIRGRLTLKDAAFQTDDLPNGISKANGAIVFTGNVATIESFTGEAGGGPIRLSGTVSRFGSTLQYDLEARANRVRVRTQAGVSTVANANIKLSGNSENSLLSGTITLQSVGFTSRTDIGSILTQASAPAETPSAPQGIIAGMRLNIGVRLAPGAIVQTALAENLELEADVTIRGTAANPGALGRVSLTQGQFVFFGTKYKVNEGSVSFFNPNKIEPVLNLNLETSARGVQVTLAVTGPIQNMSLAYQSDPPLPFEEIVGLLAAGRVPTSDPVLVARQPAAPAQSFQQMGASAVLSTAVTNPVAGQLQRVFGVSQIKIDPTFTSGSELPQARLTLQQQVSTNLTFTYVTNLTRSNPQIIRVEWAIDPRWSAIASRQENGLVALDLFYKRRIR